FNPHHSWATTIAGTGWLPGGQATKAPALRSPPPTRTKAVSAPERAEEAPGEVGRAGTSRAPARASAAMAATRSTSLERDTKNPPAEKRWCDSLAPPGPGGHRAAQALFLTRGARLG